MTATAVFLLVIGLILANLPFLVLRGRWQVVGVLVGYAAFLLFGRWLESRIGSAWPQGGFFYAITGAGFLVCGFPGFVCRHLLRPAQRS